MSGVDERSTTRCPLPNPPANRHASRARTRCRAVFQSLPYRRIPEVTPPVGRRRQACLSLLIPIHPLRRAKSLLRQRPGSSGDRILRRGLGVDAPVASPGPQVEAAPVHFRLYRHHSHVGRRLHRAVCEMAGPVERSFARRGWRSTAGMYGSAIYRSPAHILHMNGSKQNRL
jgi:hypothetical protein